MAAPEQTIPGIGDLRSFTHILDFVSDREKYTKRIAFLDEKTQECNAAVKRVVQLNALGALQTQIKQDRLAADEAVEAAQAKAKGIREAAARHADKVHTEMDKAESALRLHIGEETERLALWEKKLEGREGATNAKKRASEAELVSAENLHKKGLKLKERYGGALVALKKITDEV